MKKFFGMLSCMVRLKGPGACNFKGVYVILQGLVV